MDFISKAKDIGSSAFGSSSSGASGSGSGGTGMFSNFFNLSIQKMVLILAVIAFVISVGTVAILLWKSKSSQKWPPEIAKCPDRMELNAAGTSCVDTYGLGVAAFTPAATDCGNFDNIKGSTFSTIPGDGAYAPWEGIVDGKASRAASLKCAI
jgi:preprotein translocase subunit SecG